MTLPDEFQFSQASLQDYKDCPRRFWLRYVRRIAWPAAAVGPEQEDELYLRRGRDFHRLLRQHALGIPVAQLEATIADPDLRRWWDNYLTSPPDDLPARRYAEIALSAPLGQHRLVAKYDLIAVEAGQRAVIVDWKTSRGQPRRDRLAERLQTLVYPYVLVRAGAHINGGQPLQPSQVEMVYWFAEYPTMPGRFVYNDARHEANAAYLTDIVAEIVALDDDGFPKTTQEKHCRHCRYVSLCQRGGAGVVSLADEEEWLTEEDDLDTLFDIAQIAEVEY